MDNISKENLQELIPEAGQAMELNDEANEDRHPIFGNRIILNKILDQLPNSTLLDLSCLNKWWKEKARIELKKRGNVMVLLKTSTFEGCVEVFEAFAANLETLNEPLYSEMTIWLSLAWERGCETTGAMGVEAIHESILAGMRGQLKRLSIRLGNSPDTWHAQDCPSLRLLRLLLRDFIGDLEHLTFETTDDMEPSIQEFFPPGPYPKLKVLKLDDNCRLEEETFGSQIRMLLSRAPNLHTIHTNGNVSLRENLMEGREGVVHVHETHVLNPIQDISENVIPILRLKKTEFYYTANLNLDRFNEKAQSILRTCCATTLEHLELEAVSLVLLMSYGIRLFHVKRFFINSFDYVKVEQNDPRILSIMRRLDFTYFFPKLERICVSNRANRAYSPELSPGEIAGVIDHANKAVWRAPTLPRAGNIKYLELEHPSLSIAAVELFSQMFPAIEQLRVHQEDEVFPIESAWGHWPELKLIVVNGERYQRP